MKIGIICIGDELLIGQVIDSNSAQIGLLLSEISLTVFRKWTVSDSCEEINYALQSSVTDCDLTIISGGLGPTKDDITKKALANYFKVSLVFSEQNYQHLYNLLSARNIEVQEAHKVQCMVPSNADLLNNKLGTAMGLWMEKDNRIFIALPGVPDEMNAIMKEEVLPRLKLLSTNEITSHRTFLTVGYGETDIAYRIEPVLNEMPEFIKVAYLPAIAQVRLRLSGTHKDKNVLNETLDFYSNQIRNLLGSIIFGESDSNLAFELGKLLMNRGMKVGTVESCTGGALAAKFTSNPGSSAYFKAGLVTYATESKESLLNISTQLIEEKGVVSDEVVRSMVIEGSRFLKVDLAIATSGIAGPDGGTLQNPVGTVYIACGNEHNQIFKRLSLSRNRTRNIEAATILALSLARDWLLARS
ncbi:MAG: CinA family nicotinamide mononucleotide deamidase-related protein [Saprospiraceae bacterium]